MHAIRVVAAGDHALQVEVADPALHAQAEFDLEVVVIVPVAVGELRGDRIERVAGIR